MKCTDHGKDEPRWSMQMLPAPVGSQGYFVQSVTVWVRTSGSNTETGPQWIHRINSQRTLQRKWNLEGLIKNVGNVKHSLSRTNGAIGRAGTLNCVVLVVWPWNHDESSDLSSHICKMGSFHNFPMVISTYIMKRYLCSGLFFKG